MADVLKKLFEGEIHLEDFIKTLINKNDNKDKKRVKLAEFIPFFVNYLRKKTSHLAPRHNVTTPKKSRPQRNDNQGTPSSNQRDLQRHTPRGINFYPQRTPSPHRWLQNGEGHISPSMRRKSPRVTPNNQSIIQTPSPLTAQSKPNLNNMDDFPTIGAASTPKSSGNKTPSRRITPTPVKNDNRKSTSPFTTSPFTSTSPIGDSSLSPVSLQEERNMLRAMKSKRRNRRDDNSWGTKMSSSPHSGSKSVVLGDFISPPALERTMGRDLNTHEVNSHHSKQFLKQKNIVHPRVQCEDESQRSPGVDKTPCVTDKNSVKETIKSSNEKSNVDTTPTHTIEPDKIEYKDKINILSRLHSTLIKGCLVPNVTSEMYFVAQLLNSKPASPDKTSGPENQEQDHNVLHSIHNTVYFAVLVLENTKEIICLLDKGTLRLLAHNQRIADLSPTFNQWLNETFQAHSVPKALDTSITSPMGGVPFSADRDNKNNFPSDKAFQNFRKQRDLFYELVREWEDCHNKPGWTIEESMGNRIRSLVHQRPELANHSSFARLFQSQLLQMCKGEIPSTSENSMLANFSKSNPDKFQRLYNRFLAPMSHSGPCPPPSFTEVQEFFKGFISCAESHSFNRHLMDHLVIKLTELDSTNFHLEEHDSTSEKSIQSKEIQLSFAVCLSNLRVLAKFLGYLVFQPYCGVSNQSNQSQMEKVISMRDKIPQSFDVLLYINSALKNGHIVITVPWVIEYLSMMDPVAPYLSYYHKVLMLLAQIYRSADVCCGGHTYNRLLIITCLGWLFEAPVIPESLFFKSFEDPATHNDNIATPLPTSLDSCDIVDQQILYSCCPYLGEIKTVLSEASTGISSRTGQVKKITPVCTDKPEKMSSSNKRLLEQLEENFYRSQPEFFKRTSDFTVERLCFNILHQIKASIVPTACKKGAQEIKTYLDSIGFPSDGDSSQAKEKSRPRVLQLIHSVTSDAVAKALDIIEKSSELSLKSFQVLCPEDTNPKVINTAAKLTARHVKQKSTDWIHLSLASIVEKDLFNHFDKYTNALLHAKAKESRLQEAIKQTDKKECLVVEVNPQSPSG